MLTLDPAERISIPDIMSHHWYSRCVDKCDIFLALPYDVSSQSQIAHGGHATLADRLTQSLRQTGDMGVIDPHNA